VVSVLTRIPVHRTVAMTGEITLRGKILAIGGVKEKVLAAHRMGCEIVVLPRDNEKDLADIPANVQQEIGLRFVDTMDEVLDLALERKVEPRETILAEAESAPVLDPAPSERDREPMTN